MGPLWATAERDRVDTPMPPPLESKGPAGHKTSRALGYLVARGGIEPSTRGFSVRGFMELRGVDRYSLMPRKPSVLAALLV